MADIDFTKLWDVLKSNGMQSTMLAALLGQMATGLIWQVANNEKQEAGIRENLAAITEFKAQVSNMDTPLGRRFIALEQRVDEAIRQAQTLQSPLGQRFIQLESKANEAIGTGASRGAQLDQVTDRLILIERRLFEIETRIKDPKVFGTPP